MEITEIFIIHNLWTPNILQFPGKKNEILEKDPDVFFQIFPEVLHKHAPRKEKRPGVMSNFSWPMNYQKLHAKALAA